MTSGTEYEIKTAIESSQLASICEGFEWVSESKLSDQYFDTADRRLFLAGVFVRLRNGGRVDIKYNADINDVSHSHCSDTGYSYPLSESDKLVIREFIGEFLDLGPESDILGSCLVPFVRIEKLRNDYVRPGLTLSVDEVAGLGLFVELEADSVSHVSAMYEIFRAHSLDNLPVGYVEIYLRSYNYPLYLQGRYVLPDDK